MRIASLVPAETDAVYRARVPMQELARRGHRVHTIEREQDYDLELLREHDVVHVAHLCTEPAQQLARELKAAGVPLVWDHDQSLTPAEGAIDRGAKGRRGVVALKAMLKRADVVTTPTATLASRYRAAGAAEVRVLGNYLPSTFVPPREQIPHDGVLIGWLATPVHQLDADRLRMRELCVRLIDEHDDVKVATIGLGFGIDSDRYFQIPEAPYRQLPAFVVEADVAIAPLADTPFNRARSDVTIKEYAAMGVPWLASPVGPYAELGETQGGRLVAHDAWHDEILRLAHDEAARERLGAQGTSWAETQRIADHVDGWERALQDAIGRAQALSAR